MLTNDNIKGPAALIQFLYANPSVLHLAAIAFQTNGAGGWDFELGVEHFAVAGAMRNPVFDDGHYFVPLLRLVVLQFLPRAGEDVVATLELRFADEDAAVSVGRGAKFKFEDEVFWKFPGRPKLLNTTTLGRSGDDKSPIDRDVARIVAGFLTVKGGGGFKCFLRAKPPTSEIVPVEKAHVTRLELKVIRLGFDKPMGGQQRSQRGGPLGVTCFVRVQQVWKLRLLRIALVIGKKQPRVEHRHLRVTLHGGEVELVDFFNLISGTFLCGGTGHHIAEDDGHIGTVLLEHGDDELEVVGDHFGSGFFLKVVGAYEQHNAAWVEREHILPQPNEHPASRVAADAAVGHLHAWKAAAHRVAPALRDGVAEKHQSALILLHQLGPAAALAIPEILEPLISPNRPCAGQPLIGRRDGIF